MATKLFSAMVGEVSPYVTGCPPLEIVASLRNAAIEFCERTHLWAVDLTPIDVVASTSIYTLAPPTNTRIVMVVLLRLNDAILIDNRHIDLKLGNPSHPDTTNLGAPVNAAMVASDVVTLDPVPESSITGGLKAYCVVAPTSTATGMDETIANAHHERLVHGALYRLLLQARKPWFDAKLGDFYARKWNADMAQGRAVSELGYTKRTLNVAVRRIV